MRLVRRTKKIADFELAVAEETDHNADVLYELMYGTDEDETE